MQKLNNNEKEFVKLLDGAWRYISGDLELNHVGNEWVAMDYREEYECAYPIDAEPYNKPLITDTEAKRKGIDIVKCCNWCSAYYVG